MGNSLGGCRDKKTEFSKSSRMKTRLLHLPNELLVMILKKVDVADRRKLSQTCRRLFYAINSREELRFQKKLRGIFIYEGCHYVKFTFRGDEPENKVVRAPIIFGNEVCSETKKTQMFHKNVLREKLRETAMAALKEILELFVPTTLYFCGPRYVKAIAVAMLELHPQCAFLTKGKVPPKVNEHWFPSLIDDFLSTSLTHPSKTNSAPCRLMHVHEERSDTAEDEVERRGQYNELVESTAHAWDFMKTVRKGEKTCAILKCFEHWDTTHSRKLWLRQGHACTTSECWFIGEHYSS